MRTIRPSSRSVLLPAVAAFLFAASAQGQAGAPNDSSKSAAKPRKSSFSAGPTWLSPEDRPSSLGARWDAEWARSGGLKGKTFPRTWHLEFASVGTAALNPDANLEPIRFGGDASLFIQVYQPSRDTSANPDTPTVGGFNLGALYLAALVRVEADQGFEEVARMFGGEVRYTIDRQDGVWPLMPSFELSFLSVDPSASALRDSLNVTTESHRRLDLNVVWHVPLFRTPLRAHADLRFWTTAGLAPELKMLDRDEGARVTLGLGWTKPWTIGRIRIDEVFARWSDGSQPVITTDAKAWMIGIVANLVR